MRRVVERVVVENDVNFLRLCAEFLGTFDDFADFLIAVIVIETRRHRLAGSVGARVATVQAADKPARGS